MPGKIMIVDDELRIRRLIADYLKNDGYEVVEAENGNMAIEKYSLIKDIKLIILDVMMPEKNGWEVCREIRQSSDVPIIFLTALGELSDEISGLNIGADDYIVKPFRYEILMARIRTVLRRSKKHKDSKYCYDEIEIFFDSRCVKKNGKNLEMSPKEYELLIYIINNPNIALSRDKILNEVWGCDYFGDPRTVDTHIKNIRAKTGSFGISIKTIRGFGYKLEIEK